ncbi:MAG: hypothetical protein OEV42_05880 [Deltaproteobacteria bacterium]|nr:hypothetical protein [Deltaproteobacteria bacterium]
MTIEYQNYDSEIRGYHGVAFEEAAFRDHLSGPVKDNLLDREERDDILNSLRTLQTDTGFSSENLLEDIQALENEDVDVQIFRVGEAYAEVILEESFRSRFYWNELRDARNPRGNKTGADLVGFIVVEDQVLFLFGEVKTSSETANRPPRVMTKADGIENQLRDLYSDRQKRFILISYLQNKARIQPDGHPFREDFDRAFRSYYAGNPGYQLIGVLVRDVEPDERDVSVSYERIKEDVLEPTGLQLLALYVPVSKSEWLSILNRAE